ncbi:hypothetical protein [Methylobacterium sp. CM6257]
MRYALAAAVLLLLIEPTIAAGGIPNGSRAGMEVTVTGVEAIGTSNAVIRVRNTGERVAGRGRKDGQEVSHQHRNHDGAVR